MAFAKQEVIPRKRQKLKEEEDDDNDDREMCFYGSFCFRRDSNHLRKYKHKQRKLGPDEANLPPCKNGANCFDRNLLHFALFYHPTKSENSSEVTPLVKRYELKEKDITDRIIIPNSSKEVTTTTYTQQNNEDAANYSPSANNNDEKSEVMIEKRTTGLDSIMRKDTILSRGPSILRSYSALSEDQRKDLIRRAFEIKQNLMKKLSDTEEVLKDKTEQLETLRAKLDKNSLMVDGEANAMKENSLVYFPLYPERNYQEDSAAQIHFRLAESQFYRLLPAGSAYKVTKVEYVVQPCLINQFKKARAKLRDIRGVDASLPVLGFHGTNEKNIESICESGFRVPGEPGFQHATDPGWYGKGVYFSEYPKYSMNYIRDSSKLLLCQVLPGKVFRCKYIIQGDSLRQGHDSHMSPDGKEVVIFNSHHILPSYIVHYSIAYGDFQYEQFE
eukprot:gene12150-13403_t